MEAQFEAETLLREIQTDLEEKSKMIMEELRLASEAPRRNHRRIKPASLTVGWSYSATPKIA